MTLENMEMSALAEPDLGEFRIASAAEISAILRTLLETHTPVTLTAPGGEPVKSLLCAMDLARGTLAFELPPGSATADQLGAADGVLVETYLDHIRVQFELDAPTRSNALLRTPMPALVYRFQRRRAFRVKPNSRTPVVVLAPFPVDGEVRPPRTLRLQDISTGGAAVVLPPGHELDWDIGLALRVRVELDRQTSFEGEAVLVNLRPPKEDGRLLGIHFTSLTPDAQRTLQLYVDQTQKLQRLLRK
ncbi:MAG: flagellar brake protein [Paucibacter sp.]|nr:flagellar brake protein [Roseateles sp.]